MMDYRNLGKPGAGEMGFDTATLPLCDCGLIGPVRLCCHVAAPEKRP